MKTYFKPYYLFFLFVFGCTKLEKNIKTNIEEIDTVFNFINKKEFDFKKAGKFGTAYYLNSKEDSVYLVIESDDVRSRGWVINRIQQGDWKYETTIKSRLKLDSIINYINICNEQKVNTVKYFGENLNKPIENTGNYYLVNTSEVIEGNDTLIKFDVNIYFDINIYEDNLELGFHGFQNQKLNDFCNYIDEKRESFPIKNRKITIIIDKPREKGKYIFKGFYLIKYKFTENSFRPVITQIEYNIK